MRLETHELTRTQQHALEKAFSDHAPGPWVIVHALEGDLDVARLRAAIAGLGERTSIFGRSFVKAAGTWSMVIGSDTTPTLSEYDLRGQDSSFAFGIISDQLHHFYRPEAAPLARFHLLQLDDAWLLVFSAASWLIDRFSMTSLYEAISAGYAASGPQGEDGSLDLDQETLVTTEREFLQSPHSAAAQRFWVSQLKDRRTQFSPPRWPNDLGETTWQVPFSAASILGATDVAKQLGLTVETVMHAALHLFISRMSGSETVLTSMTRRQGQPLEPGAACPIGFAEGPTMFMSHPASDMRVRDYLLDTDRLNDYALEHSNIPAKLVIEAVRRAEPGFTHFTNVSADLDTLPYDALVLDGLDVTLLPEASYRRPSTDIAFATTGGDTPRLTVRVRDPHLLPAIRDSIGALALRLANLPGDLDTEIGTLAWLDDAGRAEMIALAGEDAPFEIMPAFLDRVVGHARTTPDAEAVRFAGESLTYRELISAADSVAARLTPILAQQGAADPLVGICLPRGMEMIIALLGVMRAGAGYVPLDPTNPPERLAYILTDSQATAVVVDAETASLVSGTEGLQIVPMSPRDEWLARVHEPLVDTPRDDSAIAYVIYTSGTTGLPKGVVIERGNLAAYLTSMEQVAACGPGSRWLQFASINFDASVLEIGNCLARGACLVVTPSELRSDPEAVIDLLEGEHITHAFIPPAMLRSLPRRSLPDLADIYVGGEASDDLTVAFWSRAARLWNAYGPTETTVMSSAKVMNAQRSAADLGGPLPGYTMYVLDPQMQPVPRGATGEIWIGGPGVTRGYLHREQLTAEKFVPNPFGPGRLYRSGDLARHFPGGDLEYLGRNDFQVKIRGFRIELGDIESAIADVHGVTGVYVTVIDGPGGKALAAWYTAPVSTAEPTAVTEEIGRRLPHYMVPTHLVRMDEFPINISGKVDRTKLPMPTEDAASSTVSAASLSPRELAVREIWAEVLGMPVATLGPDSHFFHVGGHSLAAAVACHHVVERLGLSVAPRTLFEHPVLSDFCNVIGAASDAAPLAPLVATGAVTAEVPGAMLSMLLQRAAQNGKDTAYTIVVRVDMGLDINPDRLRTAAVELLEGDPVFRTRFFEQGGRTMIAVDPDALIDVPLRSGVDLEALALEFRDTAFELGAAPLWRAEVIITSTGCSLLLAINHGIFDGWSLNLLLEELAARYDCLVAGTAFVREQPTMIDYGTWLTDHADIREQAIDYWNAKLAGATCRTELPTATGVNRPDSNRELDIMLPSATTTHLKELASELDVTLPPVLFAAYLVWLWRITGQRELSVAYPYAGRDVPNTDTVFGMFVQMGFLRITIDPAESFAELAKRVARQMIDDREHLIASPYDADISRSGAPNILFSLQSGIGLEATYGTVTFRAHEYSSRSSKADLAAILYEGADGRLEGRLEFDASALDPEAMNPLLECLIFLVPGLAGNAQASVADLPYLPADQAAKVAEFSEGGPAPEGPRTLVRALREAAEQYPASIAIDGVDRQVTFAELDRETDLLAARILRDFTPVAEQPIGLSGAKSPELVMAAVAILKAGCAYVPLDPHYPADRLRYILEDAGVSLVIADSDAAGILRATGATGLTFLDPFEVSIASDSEIAALPEADPRGLAYVIYTSGSTGRPKGVMIEHGTVPRMIRSGCELMGFVPGDRMLLLGTLNFDASVVQMFTPLLAGGTLVIPAPDAEKEPEGLHAYLREHGVTHAVATPSLVRNLPHEPLPALRYLGFGGEAIDSATAAYWSEQTAFYSMYGPTETTVMCTGGQILPGANSRIIGKPLAGYTIYLRDENLQPVPLGAVGEIVIGGGGAARGYLGRPDLTIDRFLVDPDGRDPYDIVYRSGDLGRFLADGTIEYLGRNDDQIKLRGFRIELGEIETAMQSAPGVEQAAAMVRGEGDLRMIVGYLTGPADLDIEAVRAHCAVGLPEYMVPSTFVRLESMPLNANGKLDRKALPDVSFTSTSEPPHEGLEQRIAEVWEELLRVRGIGREDDFFRLGGNSLLAARLQALLREHADLEISTSTLYANPTIAGLASSGDDTAISAALALADSGVALTEPIAPVVAAGDSTALPHVLLTGATGFLGSYLLASLLPKAGKVTCIVRGTTIDEARASLRLHVEQAGPGLGITADDLAAIDVVLGDLSAPGLGLSADDSERLANSVDTIVHCGAWVHHLYSFSTLRSSNVDATAELLRMALRGAKRATMCFVSTESTAAALEGIDSVSEAVLDAGVNPPASDSGYLLTKWVAEQLVAQASREYGLDALIARPGNITGDTTTGYSNFESNHFWLFTKGCLQLGYAPRLRQPVEMTPVDVLADAITALALDGEHGLRVTNLSNPVTVSWEAWLSRVAELSGRTIEFEEPTAWQARLADITEANALWSLRSLYAQGEIDGEELPVHHELTVAALAGLGAPTASEPSALASVYVPYLVDKGFLGS